MYVCVHVVCAYKYAYIYIFCELFACLKVPQIVYETVCLCECVCVLGGGRRKCQNIGKEGVGKAVGSEGNGRWEVGSG